MKDWTSLTYFCKPLLILSAVSLLGACSTNAATGRSQFAGLMSPDQELQVGASEHDKIVKQFGLYKDPKLQAYVDKIGARVSKQTERPDVQYKFFILDSPIVNAFALPGGYIYISRGLLALANSEAEVAGVLSHEIGHVTGRHSAERYSHGVLTSIGAAVISAAVDSSGVSQALSVGGNLYMSSYSRSQENEADSLGIRYLSRGGYDTKAMSSFLHEMQNQSALDKRAKGQSGSDYNYFSTHPATADRVAKTMQESKQYPAGGDWDKQEHLKMIEGLPYGDSAEQGFTKGQSFYHPDIGFTFTAPNGFEIVNQPSQVVAVSRSTGAAMIFDLASSKGIADPVTYMSQIWLEGKRNDLKVEQTTVNGMKTAMAAFNGQVNGKAATIRLMAIQWSPERYARFQIAVPNGASSAMVEDMKRASYSLRRLSDKEKASLKPNRIHIVAAKSGDTVGSLARKQAFTELSEERFRVLNGLAPAEQVKAGEIYKLVVN